MIKSDTYEVILIICIVLVSIIIGNIIMSNDSQRDTICKDNGFHYSSSTFYKNVEEGYLLCCKDVYEDHIEVEPICKAVKKG